MVSAADSGEVFFNLWSGGLQSVKQPFLRQETVSAETVSAFFQKIKKYEKFCISSYARRAFYGILLQTIIMGVFAYSFLTVAAPV